MATGHILVVEDSSADVYLFRVAAKQKALKSDLHFVHDGEAALEYLNRCLVDGETPFPGLIVLDLNLPKKNGRKVLAEIKSHPVFRRIPVVVFTTSLSDSDVTSSHQFQANGYISKPCGLDDYLSTLRWIEEFWLRTVEPPSSQAGAA